MAGASSEDEQMPYCVMIREFFPSIEDDSHHVSEPPGDKQYKPAQRDAHHKLAENDNYQPSHTNIGEHGQSAEPSTEHHLENDTEESNSPHNPEEHESLGVM